MTRADVLSCCGCCHRPRHLPPDHVRSRCLRATSRCSWRCSACRRHHRMRRAGDTLMFSRFVDLVEARARWVLVAWVLAAVVHDDVGSVAQRRRLPGHHRLPPGQRTVPAGRPAPRRALSRRPDHRRVGDRRRPRRGPDRHRPRLPGRAHHLARGTRQRRRRRAPCSRPAPTPIWPRSCGPATARPSSSSSASPAPPCRSTAPTWSNGSATTWTPPPPPDSTTTSPASAASAPTRSKASSDPSTCTALVTVVLVLTMLLLIYRSVVAALIPLGVDRAGVPRLPRLRQLRRTSWHQGQHPGRDLHHRDDLRSRHRLLPVPRPPATAKTSPPGTPSPSPCAAPPRSSASSSPRRPAPSSSGSRR